MAESVILGRLRLEPSHNDYDWLGAGIYFWDKSHIQVVVRDAACILGYFRPET